MPCLRFMFAASFMLAWIGCSSSFPRLLDNAAVFPTPEEAAAALEQTINTRDAAAAKRLFGSEGVDLLTTGDEEIDRRRTKKFLERYQEGHRLVQEDEDTYVIHIGNQDWSFPVPIVRHRGGWQFDAEVGRDEILTRTIGENELKALAICRFIPDIQRQYGSVDWNDDGKFEYARRILSTPGSYDGLHWDSPDFASPLGPILEEAVSEGYDVSELKSGVTAYHGYYFKIFPGKDTGDPLGNYFFLAYPAVYGESGVMSFVINQEGQLWENDLGEQTKEAVAAMAKAQDASWLDSSWNRVD